MLHVVACVFVPDKCENLLPLTKESFCRRFLFHNFLFCLIWYHLWLACWLHTTKFVTVTSYYTNYMVPLSQSCTPLFEIQDPPLGCVEAMYIGASCNMLEASVSLKGNISVSRTFSSILTLPIPQECLVEQIGGLCQMSGGRPNAKSPYYNF